ncbi:MAG: hypothetical protein COA90_10525 [Gammaproteobacteria bacterium]|nr:MAG: hypothetical protein COA90_10525 [Gammaproteobacteria bacterium]
MKRLFYATKSLDDAELISQEVHSLGIDDHHFFVFSRDENGISTHHLHGAQSIDKTDIIAAKKRSTYIAIFAFCVVLLTLLFVFDAIGVSTYGVVIVSCMAFVLVKVLATAAGGSWDEYFKGVFNKHLDAGEVIIVIDVSRKQASRIAEQLSKHPAADFLSDTFNFSSPIPD